MISDKFKDIELSVEFDKYCNKDDRMEFETGNRVLYKMCEEYPRHDTSDVIVSKVWLIGRAYAAAIERGKRPENINNDRFYYDYVADAFQNEKYLLDQKIDNLKKASEDYPSYIEDVFELHKTIINICREIQENLGIINNKIIDRRSFASKYLHFHCPEKVFIYDSRAAASVRKIIHKPYKCTRITNYDELIEKYDGEYVDFCFRVLEMAECINKDHKTMIKPRQMDSFLLNHIEGMTEKEEK